ncbi:acetyltransferase [Fusarium oxysporum f. sp. phaseoli]
MASIRPLTAIDLFDFSACNLDPFTETFDVAYYLEYLSRWPHLCRVLDGGHRCIAGYVLAKVELSSRPPPVLPYDPRTNPDPNYLPWHGHITALAITRQARRLGHAMRLSRVVEQGCDAENAWFVDLFVKDSNRPAQALYQKMGYSIFRRVVGYYSAGSDAFDMRKSLSRDTDSRHVREDGGNYKVEAFNLE